MSFDVSVSGTNAAVSRTYNADTERAHVIEEIIFGYNGDPTAGLLTVTIGGATKLSVPITKGGPGPLPFRNPIRGGINEAVVVTLAAGGSGVVGYLNVRYKLD